jgi:general secretion pathway protein K
VNTTFTKRHERKGIALIIVMIVIIVLATLAAGFAYAMKVETKLARNSTYETDMEFLGRSGVELGRYVLAEQLRIPMEGGYTALNQKWAGGFTTNELLANIDLENNQLGPGKFSVHIVDMERKFNLAMINEGNVEIFQHALESIGVDAADIPVIVDAYLDWVDPDERTHLHGAESDTYLALNPKSRYFAKNGRVDDISELLLLKGMTPSIYWGAGRTGIPVGPAASRPRASTAFLAGSPQQGASSAGLVDLFTPVSGAGLAININTASAEVLQIIPGIDAGLAHAIIDTRAGPDHQDGTEDDTPFLNTGELINVPGLDASMLNVIRQYFTIQSMVFEITVDAQIGLAHRRFSALVQRRNAQDVTLLWFRWL